MCWRLVCLSTASVDVLFWEDMQKAATMKPIKVQFNPQKEFTNLFLSAIAPKRLIDEAFGN